MEAFTLSSLSSPSTPEKETVKHLFLEDIKLQALAKALEIENNEEEVHEIEHIRDDEYRYNGGTYYVLIEEEVDNKRRDSAESLADDAESDIPEYLRDYFKRELYIEDMLQERDNESMLGYSNEEEVEINGETFYIFQE